MKKILLLLILVANTVAQAQFRRSSDSNAYPYTASLQGNYVFIIGRPGVTNYNYASSNLLDTVTNISAYQTSIGTNNFLSTVTNIAAYQAYLATNNFVVSEDIYVTNAYITNLYSTNAYITNLFATTQVTSNSFITNLFATSEYVTNLFATTEVVTNLYVSNAFVSNIYVTNITVTGNTTNLNLNANQFMATGASKEQISTLNGASLTNIQCTNIVLVTKAPFSTNYTVRLVDQVIACTGTNQLITLPDPTSIQLGTLFCFLMSSTTGYGSAIVTNDNGARTILTSSALSQTITNGQTLTILWDGNNWR